MAIEEIPGSAQTFHRSWDARRMLGELRNALEWLSSTAGRDSRKSRFGAHLRVLEDWQGGRISVRGDGVLPILNATNDAHELLEIHQTLSQIESAELPRKLAVYMSGPQLEKSESTDSSSNDARNAGFELLMLARMRQCGLDATLSSSADVVADDGRFHLAIECKRPQSPAKISDAIRKAHRQLRLRKQGKQPSQRFIGIVAVSVGKLLHGADKFVLTNHPEGFSRFCDSELEQLREICDHRWYPPEHEDYSHLLVLNLRAFVLDDRSGVPVAGEQTHFIQRDLYSGVTAKFLSQMPIRLRGILDWGKNH